VGVPRLNMAHKLVAVAMGEWAVIHIVELISTIATGMNWVTRASCGDKCSPSRSSRVATVRVCPAVVLGSSPCHLEVGGCEGNLLWLPVKAGVSVHSQEYLCLPKVLLDGHLLLVYALFQGIEVFPPLALLACFFLQGDVPMEHFHLLMGDAPQPVHLSLYAEVSQPI